MNSTVSSLSSIYTLRPCCLFVWHFSSRKPAFPHDAVSRKTRNQTVPRWNAVLFSLAAATHSRHSKERKWLWLTSSKLYCSLIDIKILATRERWFFLLVKCSSNNVVAALVCKYTSYVPGLHLFSSWLVFLQSRNQVKFHFLHKHTPDTLICMNDFVFELCVLTALKEIIK